MRQTGTCRHCGAPPNVEADRDRLEKEVGRWKLASGLIDSRGDPDGVTPEASQRNREALEAQLLDHDRVETERLDRLAALCGCPEWDYPGQVERDVAAVVADRDRYRTALEAIVQRFEDGSVSTKVLADIASDAIRARGTEES